MQDPIGAMGAQDPAPSGLQSLTGGQADPKLLELLAQLLGIDIQQLLGAQGGLGGGEYDDTGTTNTEDDARAPHTGQGVSYGMSETEDAGAGIGADPNSFDFTNMPPNLRSLLGRQR